MKKARKALAVITSLVMFACASLAAMSTDAAVVTDNTRSEFDSGEETVDVRILFNFDAKILDRVKSEAHQKAEELSKEYYDSLDVLKYTESERLSMQREYFNVSYERLSKELPEKAKKDLAKPVLEDIGVDITEDIEYPNYGLILCKLNKEQLSKAEKSDIIKSVSIDKDWNNENYIGSPSIYPVITGTTTTGANTTYTTSTTTAAAATTEIPDKPKLTAVVLSISDTTMLLKPDKGSDYFNICDRFILARKEMSNDVTPTVGMKLEITHSGAFLTTYPSRFGKVENVSVVSDVPAVTKGDTNCDDQVDMADAVLIMQALANPDKYGEKANGYGRLTALGKLNGDMNGDGLTVGDAQAIQKKLLGLSENEQSEESLIGRTYVYEKEGAGGPFTLTLNDNGKFACYEGSILSYMSAGTWELNGDIVELASPPDESPEQTVYLKVEGSDLVYIGEKSDNFTNVKVQDGEKFTDTKIRSKVDWYDDYMFSLKKDTDWSRKNSNLSAVIKDTDELKNYLEQFCSEKVMSDYLDKYDDSFFKDNVLFMKWIFQGSGSAGPVYMVNVTMQPKGLCMFIMYNGLLDGDDMASACLAQVIVPKESYDDSKEYKWVGYNVTI